MKRFALLAFIFFSTMAAYAKAPVTIKSMPDNIQGLKSDTVLLKYFEILQKDTDSHREYLEKYYSHLEWLIGGLGALIVAFFTIYSNFIIRNTSQKLVLELEKNTKEHLNNRVNEIIEDFERRLIPINEKVRSFDTYLGQLNSRVVGIEQTKNLKIVSSITKLEYLTSKGSTVQIGDYVKIKFTDNDPAKPGYEEWYRTFSLDAPGEIESIKTNPEYLNIFDTRQYKSLKFRFDPVQYDHEYNIATTIVVKNGYIKNIEWFDLSHKNSIDLDIFEIKFYNNRPCKKIYSCLIDKDENQIGPELINSNPVIDQNQTCYRFEFSDIKPDTTHRVKWEF